MRINDRLMTLATGAFLAIGGAGVSLFLGEDQQVENTADTVVIASLSGPVVPVVSAIDVTFPADIPMTEEQIATPETPELIFAAVEPAQRTEGDDARLDLAEVAIVAGMDVLAVPSDFSNIVPTRTPAADAGQVEVLTASNLPDLSFDIVKLMKVKTSTELSCALDVRATPIFGARVKLKVSAPCHPNVVVTVKHGGLQFKEQLDGNGKIELKIPAFAEYARFDIELADGTTSTVGAYIAGLSSVERVGIAWAGENDTFLHALQNGAKTGDQDHIWRLNTKSFAKSRMNGGGYMVLLGDPSLNDAEMAQVFTLPMKAQKRAQIVELHIETLRGDNACGQDMALRIAHHRVNSGAAEREMSLTLPACGAEQNTLLLKNTIKDMKVARK